MLNLKNPLPKGSITARNGQLFIGTKPVFMFGANFTWDSITALSPVDFAQYCLDRGFNWVRFHKIMPGIDIYPYVNELYNAGIRSSVDILLSEDAVRFYEGDRVKFSQVASSLEKVLKHRGLWMCQVCNEGATPMLGRPNMVENLKAGYAYAVQTLRGLGYQGLVGDLPDGNIHSELFIPAIKDQDLVLAHGYGRHPIEGNTKYIELLWAQNPHFYGVSQQITDATQLPLVWQEAGCFLDQRRHINEAFHALNCLNQGASGLCFFLWAGNHAQMRGENADPMAINCDYVRLVANIGAALCARYRGGLSQATSDGPNFTYKTSQIEAEVTEWTAKIVIKPSDKKRIVILLESVLTHGFHATPTPDGWLKVDSFGEDRRWHLTGSRIDLGAPVSSVKRIDPRTLETAATLPVAGNGFTSDYSCAVYEVTLI